MNESGQSSTRGPSNTVGLTSILIDGSVVAMIEGTAD